MEYEKLIKAAAELIAEAIKKDQSNRYSLLSSIIYPALDCSRWFSPFNYEDDLLKIEIADKKKIRITVKEFDGLSANIWDGTSLYPDSDRPIFFASLLHDILYYDMKLMSTRVGVPENSIRAFADVAFANLCEKYGASSLKTRAIYTVLRLGGGIYHWIQGLLLAAILFLFASSCSSCQYPNIIEEGEAPIPTYEKVACRGLYGLRVRTLPRWPTRLYTRQSQFLWTEVSRSFLMKTQKY